MITIDRGNGIEEFDEALLTPNHSIEETDDYRKEITKYLLNGVVVHSSANVQLKKGLEYIIEQGVLGK